MLSTLACYPTHLRVRWRPDLRWRWMQGLMWPGACWFWACAQGALHPRVPKLFRANPVGSCVSVADRLWEIHRKITPEGHGEKREEREEKARRRHGRARVWARMCVGDTPGTQQWSCKLANRKAVLRQSSPHGSCSGQQSHWARTFSGSLPTPSSTAEVCVCICSARVIRYV